MGAELSANGTLVPILAPCVEGPAQSWVLVSDASGAMRFTTLLGGIAMCLDVVDGSNRPAFAECAARPSQLWRLVSTGRGMLRLTNEALGPDRCLDVINDGTNNQVQLAACGNYSGQFWSIPGSGY